MNVVCEGRQWEGEAAWNRPCSWTYTTRYSTSSSLSSSSYPAVEYTCIVYSWTYTPRYSSSPSLLSSSSYHHMLNICFVCSWTYTPQCSSSSSSLLSSMLLNMRMQLDIYYTSQSSLSWSSISSPPPSSSSYYAAGHIQHSVHHHHHLELSLSAERITQREMKLRVAIVWQCKEILNSWKGTKVICKSFPLFMDRQFNYTGQLLKIIRNQISWKT